MPIADQSRWRYVVTDMSGSTAGGGGYVVNASQRQYNYHKNAGKTAQFTIGIDNPVANFVLTHDCLMKVYRRQKSSGSWVLLMVGDVIEVDESGQGDTGLITVVGADPVWRFHRKLIGMGVDPTTAKGIGYQDALPTAMIDYSNLMYDIVTSVNSVFYSGVTPVIASYCGVTGYQGIVYAQNSADLIQQLCNLLGGPDFEIAPNEPAGLMPNTQIGTFYIYKSLGINRPNCVFEYGIGQHNVATYDRILSKDGLCNQAYSPPQGFPDVPNAGDSMVIGQDSTSIAALGLYQDIVQGDMVSPALRQTLANEYVIVRKYARQQITFTPTVDCPLDYTADYNVGDTVQARAYVQGTFRYNGTARIYGIDFSIDDNDAETPALTLIPG